MTVRSGQSPGASFPAARRGAIIVRSQPGRLSRDCLAQQLRQLGKNGSVEETDACFIVKDHAGHSLAYVYFEEERRSLLAGFPHAWLNRQSSDSRHSPWRGNAYGGALRVAQEEAVNTTKQQRTHQSAVEMDELGWRWALKLADVERREYYHKQPAQISHALPSALLNVTVRPTLH